MDETRQIAADRSDAETQDQIIDRREARKSARYSDTQASESKPVVSSQAESGTKQANDTMPRFTENSVSKMDRVGQMHKTGKTVTGTTKSSARYDPNHFANASGKTIRKTVEGAIKTLKKSIKTAERSLKTTAKTS